MRGNFRGAPLRPFLGCLFAAGPAFGQLKATTAFGITVTPDQIVNTIYESQEFWPQVNRHLVSERFPVAEMKDRKECAAFLKKIQDMLAERLFDTDDTKVQDMLDYLAARIRNYQMLGQVRTMINDDVKFAMLLHFWESERRAIAQLPQDRREAGWKELMAELKSHHEQLKIDSALVSDVMDLWSLAAKNQQCINETGVGKLFIETEGKVKHFDPQQRELLRQVVRAADWAMITRTPKQAVKVADFVKAWHQCASYEQQMSLRDRPTKSR